MKVCKQSSGWKIFSTNYTCWFQKTLLKSDFGKVFISKLFSSITFSISPLHISIHFNTFHWCHWFQPLCHPSYLLVSHSEESVLHNAKLKPFRCPHVPIQKTNKQSIGHYRTLYHTGSLFPFFEYWYYASQNGNTWLSMYCDRHHSQRTLYL